MTHWTKISRGLRRPLAQLLVPLPALVLALLMLAPAAAEQRLPLDRIRLPPGFSIAVFADNVPNARSLALGRNNILFVSTMSEGKVYAVRYQGDHATQVLTLASRLNAPNGVALHDGALYVGEISRILRFDDVEAHLDDYVSRKRSPVVVTDRYPGDRHHGAKFIRFGPDGWLYVPVGAPCNICVPDAEHGLISRIRPDGSGYEVVARGVRNSVGFDWDPATRELWFTDNGRDNLGDDLPSDELNHVTRAGQNFGYPYCHQGDTIDPDLGRNGPPCSEFVPPVVKLGAHVAALGASFYSGAQFPAEYHDNLFIAEHGSWNRSRKSGYRVVRVMTGAGKALDGAGAVKQEVFADGWMENESAWGRPVDVKPMPDGSLLVSDDMAGVVYRISYQK